MTLRDLFSGSSFFIFPGLNGFKISFCWFDFALSSLNLTVLFGNTTATGLGTFSVFELDLCFQVRRGGIGAQCGLVFAYNSSSDKFHAEEHFKRFEKYDKWKLQEFRQFVKSR